MIALLFACQALLPPEPRPLVAVPVAARDLEVGVHITAEDLRFVPTPPELVPPGVVLDPAHLLDHVPSSRILAGETLRPERLADRELQVALEALVPPGLEVTSFDLDPGAAHVPVPGTERVDVLRGGKVVAAALPVFRVDGDRVAVVAPPEQVRELSDLAREGALTVVPAAAAELR